MDNQVIRVIEALCRDVGTPRALAVKLMVNAGEWAQLQQLRCRPQDYQDLGGLSSIRKDVPESESYWQDNLVTEILRKCDLPSSVDREAAAVQTFHDCEVANCTTNVRLSRYMPETLFLEEQDIPVVDFISRWRKDVWTLLGNLPDTLTPRFSSGATYADTGLLITIPDKMSSTPTIYSSGRCLLPLWGETAWSRALVKGRPWRSDPREVRGNIFFTVPKDGTKFRGCAKEASIMVSYQLDAGRVMKAKLLKIGIDLRQGQALHRSLAREASLSGHLATIDMSNASDTLCRLLPKLVLRDDWWELLNSLRATHTRVNGKWFRLEKFSSMGNGFTFELETVIFATLARAVIRDGGGDPDIVKCYGDDLIVPVEHYRDVVAALRLFGFQPNMKKTFAEGPFRESCGGDFWSGIPVRGHYIEELPDEPQHWISLANGLRRVAFADGAHPTRWDVVRTAWLRCLDPIPNRIRRCRGPAHLGDVVIHDAESEWAWAKPPMLLDSDGWEQTWVYAYIPVPKVLPWHHWLPTVQLASCTLGLPSTGVTPRSKGEDVVTGYRIGRVSATLTSSWVPISEPPKFYREAELDKSVLDVTQVTEEIDPKVLADYLA
jgi:hypothetical protein